MLMANRRDAPVAPIRFGFRAAFFLAGLTVAGILIHGYHYGFDDQSVYLPAVKKSLDPGLYPFDSAFFLLQTRLGCFVDALAASIRVTHLPVDWAVLCWHFASIFLILAGAWRIMRRSFRSPAGVYGSLLLLTVLFTLPVAGTFVVLCDPYLHTRAVATGFLLFALADILEKRLSAAIWILLSLLTHPTVALLGLWHLAVQAWPARAEKPANVHIAAFTAPALAALPAGLLARWLADPSDRAWRAALSGRRYLFPAQWTWYELLGAFAPLVILFLYARIGRRHDLNELARVCHRFVISGGIGLAAGMVVGLTPALISLVPLEPLRTLHLVYLMMILYTGGLCAELLPRPWKLVSAALLVPLALGMFMAQRAELAASPHIEWPGVPPPNDWQQSFAWIRANAPRNALFAMNPDFLLLEGENEHGFRGLAERSQLAESAKDRAVSRNLPALAWEWRDEVRAQEGIEGFDLAHLRDLRLRYGVNWLLLMRGAGRAASLRNLDCPYENRTLSVCRCP